MTVTREIAEHEALMGVELDPKGSEAPAIMVMLGGMDGAAPHLRGAA